MYKNLNTDCPMLVMSYVLLYFPCPARGGPLIVNKYLAYDILEYNSIIPF